MTKTAGSWCCWLAGVSEETVYDIVWCGKPTICCRWSGFNVSWTSFFAWHPRVSLLLKGCGAEYSTINRTALVIILDGEKHHPEPEALYHMLRVLQRPSIIRAKENSVLPCPSGKRYLVTWLTAWMSLYILQGSR